MSKWYDDRHNLATVARYMGERGDSVDDVAYMLEKPEKYADDWQAVAAQVGTCPTCGPKRTEQHPRHPSVIRCANCKEWLRGSPDV